MRYGPSKRASRGQANLAVLGVAVLLLTIVTGVSLALADGALDSATREPLERHAASAVAERLIAPDASTTLRANVVRAGELDALSPAALDRLAPAAAGHDVRVRVGDETVVDRGSPRDGTTVRRIVLVAERTRVTRTVAIRDGAVTLPRRTRTVDLAIRPAAGTTVETVRANGRVVLHDTSGLAGTVRVRTSRFETTTLTFATRGTDRGTIDVTYFPIRTTKAVLRVTVDV